MYILLTSNGRAETYTDAELNEAEDFTEGERATIRVIRVGRWASLSDGAKVANVGDIL